MYSATIPHLPLSWQRKAAQWVAVHDRLRPDALRPAGAQPQVLRGAPDPVGRAAAAAGVRRRDAEARTSRASTATPCTSRTAPVVGLRRDHLRDGLQHHLPVLRPRASSARRTTRSGCTSGCSSPASTTWCSSGFAQAMPTLFPFVECQARLLAAYAVGALRAAVVAEMERVIDADQQLYIGHCTTGRGTPSRSTTSSTSTTCAPRRSRPARPRAAQRRAGMAARERPATGGRRRRATSGAARCSSRSTTTSQESSLDVDQHRRHLATGRRDPLGVLLLLREQGRAVAALMERDVRRVVRGRRGAARGDGVAGREHRGDGPRAVLDAGTSTSTCSRAMLDARATSAAVREHVGHATGSRSSPWSPR